jgi:transcriptional regulator with XRE-family HTH domain
MTQSKALPEDTRAPRSADPPAIHSPDLGHEQPTPHHAARGRAAGTLVCVTFPADRYLRAARRRADLSQRELADKAGVPQSTVARVERLPTKASVSSVAILLAATGLRLAVLDQDGAEVEPEDESDADRRDRGHRRYPAHLDLRPGSDHWWGYGWPMFDGKEPEFTFDRDRWTRDWRREKAEQRRRQRAG